MVKVLHVVERYLDLSAGFVHAHIAASRHQTTVLSRLKPVNLDAFPVSGVTQVAGWADPLPHAITDRVARRSVRRAASGHDIAHAHFAYALPYTRFLSTEMPVVASFHGHDVTAWADENPWAFTSDPNDVAAVIVPSDWFRRFPERLGFAADRIRVIPSGVDTSFFTPTPLPEAPTVGFVGRLVEKKGIDVLMAAWPTVRAAVAGATLHVVGDGPLAPSVTGEGVMYTPPNPSRRREQVRELVRGSMVMTTPSHTASDGDAESLLLVNLEAQASGRPVVTTRHGGIPEYVADGTTALVVAESDVAALADALIALLRDRGLATRLGEAGPDFARQWDSAAMTAQVDDLYESLT